MNKVLTVEFVGDLVERVNHYLADNNQIEQKVKLAQKRLTKLEKAIARKPVLQKTVDKIEVGRDVARLHYKFPLSILTVQAGKVARIKGTSRKPGFGRALGKI